MQLLDPLDSTNTVLDDVLIALTGVFALVPGAGFIVDDIEGFTEGWTAFAQVRHFSGFPFSPSGLRFERHVSGCYGYLKYSLNISTSLVNRIYMQHWEC